MKHEKDFVDICKKLGKKIKIERKNKLISIKELSNLTGIRSSYIKRIEVGKAYRIRLIKHLLKIASVLKLKLSDLFNFK